MLPLDSEEFIMSTEHKVKQSECIYSISDGYGFFPNTVWNDPSNAELKERRQVPGILFPGDIVVVPDKQLLPGALNWLHMTFVPPHPRYTLGV
jgi:hypothetical protein